MGLNDLIAQHVYNEKKKPVKLWRLFCLIPYFPQMLNFSLVSSRILINVLIRWWSIPMWSWIKIEAEDGFILLLNGVQSFLSFMLVLSSLKHYLAMNESYQPASQEETSLMQKFKVDFFFES